QGEDEEDAIYALMRLHHSTLAGTGREPRAPAASRLMTISGMPTPKDQRMPKCSATYPSSGGPSRNATKEICASEATLVAAGRSVRCAAADMAKGKMTLEPAPISAKLTKAIQSAVAKKTPSVPSAMMPS